MDLISSTCIFTTSKIWKAVPSNFWFLFVPIDGNKAYSSAAPARLPELAAVSRRIQDGRSVLGGSRVEGGRPLPWRRVRAGTLTSGGPVRVVSGVQCAGLLVEHWSGEGTNEQMGLRLVCGIYTSGM
jgi:hypothetical protein